MLSEEEEKKIHTKMESLRDEYMRDEILNREKPSFENSVIAYTYEQIENLVRLSENLVKSTDRLKSWTIAIAILTFFMIGTTIANILILIRH